MLRKSLKVAAWAGGGIVVALGLAVGALALALWHGPIDASFLAPRIDQALAPADGSFRIRSRATRIAWEGWSRGLRVQVADVTAVRRDGTELARFPLLSVQLGIPSLIAGRFSVTRIALHKPHIRLVRDATGRLTLGLDRHRPGADPIGPRFFRALANRPGTEGTVGALQSIEIVSGTLTISDPSLKRSWTTRNLNAQFDRDLAGISGNLSFDLTISGRLVHFAARAAYTRVNQETRLKLRFKGLDPALFASARGAMAALTWVTVPLSGAGTLKITGDGRVRRAKLDFTGAAGVIKIPGVYNKPLPVRAIKLKGALSHDGRVLRIDTFDADLGIAKLTAKGVFKGSAHDFSFAGNVAVGRFPATGLRRLWPDGVQRRAKRWVTTNVGRGTIKGLRVAVRLHTTNDPATPVALETVDGAFEFTGVRVTYYRYLPPVTGARGRARFDGKGLHFYISRGRTADIEVGRTTVRITGFHDPKQALAVSTRLKGTMSRIMTVLDRKPLRFAQKLDVSPLALKGHATATLDAHMKLLKTLTIGDVDIAAKARIAGLYWRKGLFGLNVAKGAFALTVTKAGMRMKGRARLGGEDARIDWHEAFGETKGPRRTFGIATVFAPETLARTGLDIRKFISGKFGAKLEIKGYDDGRNIIDGVYDFKRARFEVPLLGIVKPVGMPAHGRSRIELDNQRVAAVPRFALDSPVIKARGAARFYGDGVTLKLLRIGKLDAGRTNLTAHITGTARGAKTIRLTGRALDLRPLLKAADEPPRKDRPTPAATVVAHLGRVYFAPDRYVSNVKGRLRYDGRRWRAIALRGQVAKAAPLAIDYAAGPGGRTLKAHAANAGAALRALNIVDQVRGGRLDVNGAAKAGAKRKGIIGTLTIKNFRVSRAPTMARLLALASQQGLANWASSDKGLHFREFTAPFRVLQGIVYLRDARAVGSQVGFTFTGALDLAKETARFNGTLVPLYSLNTVIGKVPVIGRVIVGEKGGGLLAVRYTVAGPLKNPQIAVNPLSMLTPGLLRKLFDIGNAAPQPEDERPKAPKRLKPDPRYKR